MRSTQPSNPGVEYEAASKPRPQTRHLLIVDDDQGVREAIADALAAPRRRVHQAASLDEARRALRAKPIDLALIDVALPDGDGYELADEINASTSATRSIIITGQATLDRAVDAIRSGAVDFLSKPLNLNELNERVAAAMKLQQHDRRRRHQFDRLKKLCKKLNQARHEITDQVDILCNDLVTAYQELAGQVNKLEKRPPAPVGEAAQDDRHKLDAVLEGELDLEQVLRRTMEHLLDAAGPSNVMIFLPSSGGGFTVGGYVNYSYEKAELAVLMQQLAGEAAEKIADLTDPLLLARDDEVEHWLEQGRAWLEGMQVLAMPCHDDAGEVLAGVMLFRPADEPITQPVVDELCATAPVLTDHLIKVIGVHHRMKDHFDNEGGMAA